MAKSTWTRQLERRLIELYSSHTCDEIGKMLGFTALAIKSRAGKLGIVKRQFWTSADIEYLKKHYGDTATHVIASHLGKSISSVFGQVYKLDLHQSEAFKNSPLSGRIRPGAAIGGATRFKKGQVSWNNGKKMPEGWSTPGMKRTQFKKGQLPKNTKTDGEITVRTNYKRRTKYYYKRVALGKWKELHRLLWQEHHGPIPRGYNVQFKDGNTLNCTIENLYLIPRNEQMKQNTIHRYTPEVKSAIRLVGKLKRKIKTYEKQD